MNRQRLIIISIVAVIILGLILGLIWWFTRPEPADPITNSNTVIENSSNTTTITTTTNSVDTNTDTTVTPVERDDVQAITSVSKSFTERFGSYSTDTHFENIERSRYLMTDAMSGQADKLIENTDAASTFTSVDSTATTVNLTDFAPGSTGATVEVAVRQAKRSELGEVTYENVTARLTLKKIDSSWKVDSFRWL